MAVDQFHDSVFGAVGPAPAAAFRARPIRRAAAAAPSCALGFALFLLVNAVLFIRPAEIVPSLEELPVYEILIVACLLSSLPVVVSQLNGPALQANPTTACVIGVLAALVLSQLTNFSLYEARTGGFEFGKVVVYYLLCVGLLNSLARFRLFLLSVVGFVTVLSVLALLQYEGAIDLPALEAIQQRDVDDATGEDVTYYRLCSTGIYNDPNDLCLILVAGMVISVYWLTDSHARILWRLPAVPLLGLFGYGLSLTQSRGGFIGLVAAVLVLFGSHFKWWKTVGLAALTVPVMFLLFAGRQTNINTGQDDTLQARIQLWSEGLQLFREAPLFGIGYREYAEQAGQVAHNSFAHCYTELGFFGGTAFLGAFVCGLLGLYRLGQQPGPRGHAGLERLRPFVLTLLTGYAAGMLSLSRAYVVPTYMVFGLATAYVRLASAPGRAPVVRLNGRLGLTLALASLAYLASLYVFVRMFARFG